MTRLTKVLLAGIVASVVLSGLGIHAGGLGGVTPARSAPVPVGFGSGGTPPSTGANSSSSGPPAANTSESDNPAGAIASAAAAAAVAAGIKGNVVFEPRSSATPAQEALARSSGRVEPLYRGTPAPTGLADYGLSAGPGNSVVASILNTTSLRAVADFNGTGVRPMDLYQSSPDGFALQLNAVLTNVTLAGVHGYTFWAQNVVEFFPDSHLMVLITNVWNFSAPEAGMPASTIYSHGPLGTGLYPLLGFYYAEDNLSSPISYPFNLTLFLNSTLVDGRDAVKFAVSLNDSSESFHLAYDDVVFNSFRTGGLALATPSNFTANGEAYNPVGLTNDFEFVLGGPGDGSQADLFEADATLGLSYLAGATYRSIPSAYNYGGETGETSTGGYVAWSDSPGGPDGAATYGELTTGPSILSGLWNASGPEGSYPLFVDLSPSNAFVFVTPVGFAANFTVAALVYAPTVFTSTLYLAPGSYRLLVGLSDFEPTIVNVTLTGSDGVGVDLTSNATLGIYTPLWAWTNTQLAALSSGGIGTPTDPYVLVNTQPADLSPLFGLYNGYSFPVFPGVFLWGTNASVELDQPASFATTTNTTEGSGASLPPVNDLQFWFVNVSNVALVNGRSLGSDGWFAKSAWLPTGFNTFDVIFYESSNNLVAGSSFETAAGALLLYSGGSPFAPGAIGGGNNTVWGNSFLGRIDLPSSGEALAPSSDELGLEVAESNDTIYNNEFSTPTTAWQLPLNLYSGMAQFFTNRWNITPQPASDVHYAPGFPLVPLSGSILGTRSQGGNVWWDYGSADNLFNGAVNPYGVLPYDENATTVLASIYGPEYYDSSYIYPGGDYDPLINVSLYNVTFSEDGLLAGAGPWGVSVEGAGLVPLDSFSTTAASRTVELPNATGDAADLVTIVAPYGYEVVGPTSVTLTIPGAPVSMVVEFAPARGAHVLRFVEAGLPSGTPWSISIAGTRAATWPFNATETAEDSVSLDFTAGVGSYTWTVAPVAGFVPRAASGTVGVHGSPTVHLKFSSYKYAVTFTETGLPTGKSWSMKVGTVVKSSKGSSIVFDLANGSYPYTVHKKPGYNISTSASVTVNGSAVDVPVAFTQILYSVVFDESGLPGGAAWSASLAGVSHNSSGGATVVFTVARNGTFAYTIPSVTVSGPVEETYRAIPAGAQVHVHGGLVTVDVRFVS